MSNSSLCVDANLVIRLIADPKDEAVRQMWEQWDAEHRQIATPTLLYYEVSNALYRYQRAGMISSSVVRMALKAALALPVRLYGDEELHRRALALAERFSLPAAYDAHYLALADWLGGEFWTADPRLFPAQQVPILTGELHRGNHPPCQQKIFEGTTTHHSPTPRAKAHRRDPGQSGSLAPPAPHRPRPQRHLPAIGLFADVRRSGVESDGMGTNNYR